MKYKVLLISISVICCMYFTSCKGGYSFTGASIPVDAKTISVHTFPNNARLVQPQLSQILTDGLRNKFMNQTRLSLADYNGDFDMSGEITDYSIVPIGIQVGDNAALNRLTITVRVNFINTKDTKTNFNQTFSEHEDYPSDRNLSEVEDGLMNEISKKLVEQIFKKAVIDNW